VKKGRRVSRRQSREVLQGPLGDVLFRSPVHAGTLCSSPMLEDWGFSTSRCSREVLQGPPCDSDAVLAACPRWVTSTWRSTRARFTCPHSKGAPEEAVTEWLQA